MSTREITTDDLLKVKRMGGTKATKVLELVRDSANPGALKEGDFAAINGVSEQMAKELVKLVQDPDDYEPQPPTPRKKTAKKTTKKRATAKKAKVVTNGHASVAAGEVRKFARDAESLGLAPLAKNLRDRVAPLLDDEKVEISALH